jgi:hypothetical protein
MLAGDIFYLAVLLGCAALAGVRVSGFRQRLEHDPVPQR